MDSNTDLNDSRLANAWAELNNHAVNGNPLHADAYRLAFADPEFLLRRETRGIRFQTEMLKPDLGQTAQGIENTVVVYGSARFIAPDEAEQHRRCRGQRRRQPHRARQAGRAQRPLLRPGAAIRARGRRAQRAKAPADRIYVCTGGGPGIMEAANRGAHDVGALNVGLNIALPHEQSGNRFISPSLSYKFHYFALRKMHFMMRAKALLAFPGGFGTLDELFEVLTLVQTGKAKPVPIVLFGTDFWRKVVNFDALVEQGTISAADLNLFHYTDDPQEAWNIIKAFYKL